MASPASTQALPVLIVGAGPAGLVAAITLARHGVRVLVVEKRANSSTLPRALVISTRSMEILRSWGLEEAVRKGAADVEPVARVARTLASPEETIQPMGYPTPADAARISPTRPSWAPQDHTEPLLLEELRRHSVAAIRFGIELVGLRADARAAHVQLRHVDSGRVDDVEADYVIGADGAHSIVRSELGIPMLGRGDLAEFHSVQFEASLEHLLGQVRCGLNIVTHPDAAGVLAPRGGRGRWGYSREWHPGTPRLVDIPDSQVAQLVTTAIGVADTKLRLGRRVVFSFAAQIAERYRSGRVFLVGDAAHRMTPRGGTGMNTAIQDGFDLGWKLAWVLRGWASRSLLDTYETERRPVGAHNVARSERADGARQTVDEALPWDLNGRVGHHWLERGHRRVSTLDLVGDGFAVLASWRQPDWTLAIDRLQLPMPVSVHAVDDETTEALGIPMGGALLLRPDAHSHRVWNRVSDTSVVDFTLASDSTHGDIEMVTQ
jgi:putative polyketide hydroxylase